jgi:hypothetical protein
MGDVTALCLGAGSGGVHASAAPVTGLVEYRGGWFPYERVSGAIVSGSCLGMGSGGTHVATNPVIVAVE